MNNAWSNYVAQERLADRHARRRGQVAERSFGTSLVTNSAWLRHSGLGRNRDRVRGCEFLGILANSLALTAASCCRE